MVLAVDVGGVLASKSHDGEPVAGSLEAIVWLSKHYDLWIVSMCGVQRAENTKVWLRVHGFEDIIPRVKQIYIPFKAKNKNEQLIRIAAHALVDDRMKHITPALNIGVRCIHFGGDPIPKEYRQADYLHAPDWEGVKTLLVYWAAVILVAGAILVPAVFPRYEYRLIQDGRAMVIYDRWAASMPAAYDDSAPRQTTSFMMLAFR